MKRFSLQFLGKDVETQYRTMLYNTTCFTIKRNFSLLTLLSFVWLTLNIIRYSSFNISTFVPFILLIVFGLVTLSCNKIPNMLDYILLMFQLLLNMIWVVCYILSLHTGYFEEINSYYLGYVLSYLTQCYNIGSRTNLKLFSILINTTQMLIVISLRHKAFGFTSVLVVFSGVMNMYHIHQDDRCRRQAYLIKIQQEQWEQNLDEVAEIGLIQCTFDKKNHSLKLHKSNEISFKKFLVKDQMSCLEFMRHIHLSSPNNNKQQSKGKINLEQLLFYIFTDFDKSSPLVNSFKCINEKQKYGTCTFKAKGVFNQTNYKVQIFQFWKAEQITVISVKIKTMKCRLQILQMALRNYQQQIQQSIVPSIALIQKLMDFQQQQNLSNNFNQQVLSKLMEHSYYNLYESYRKDINILIYFKSRFNMKHQLFRPAQVIKNAIKILDYQINFKYLRVITKQSVEQIQMKSCYQLFHQLILNILAQIIQVSKRHGDINITHHLEMIDKREQNTILSDNNQPNNSQCIEFIISTNTISTSELLQNQIWVMNPLSLRDCKKACYPKELNINLCISRHIVGLLGPFCKIDYIQDEQTCAIHFKIYQNLHDMKSFQMFNKKKIALRTP